MRKNLLNLCATALLSVVSTAAWALSEVGGVYQIGTAEDLKAFAELVNGDNPYACAVLTADIDKGTDNTQIGRDGQDFQGVFDGAGHTITYNMTFTANGAGLFRNVGVHAVIQNLKVQGTLNSNSSFAGGVAGWSSGRIRGCYVDVTINSSKEGDATDGGMIGIAYRGTVIENCLAKIQILGESTTNCGGVVGWAENKINVANCLVVSDGSNFKYTDASNGHSSNIARNEGNLNVVNLATYNANPYSNRPAGANYNNYVTVNWGTCNATTVVPLADLADGKVCYQLNNDQSKINWVQKLGEGGDPFPVPVAFGSLENQVYASGATGCNGQGESLTYSNEGTVQATAHTFDKYGICTTCGCFNFSGFDEYDTDDAIVMSWRGTKGGVAAARQNHRVIMSPNVFAYIDHPQLADLSKSPRTTDSYVVSCSKMYSFEPLVPEELTEEQGNNILGVQANLWTEHVAYPEHAFYQLLPRLASMSEVQWCNPGQKDFEDWKRRLPQLKNLYKKMGVVYCNEVE